jgi:hypothetical protein
MAKKCAALCGSDAFLYFSTMLIMLEPVTPASRRVILSLRRRDMVKKFGARPQENPTTMIRSRRGPGNPHRSVNTTQATLFPTPTHLPGREVGGRRAEPWHDA